MSGNADTVLTSVQWSLECSCSKDSIGEGTDGGVGVGVGEP